MMDSSRTSWRDRPAARRGFPRPAEVTARRGSRHCRRASIAVFLLLVALFGPSVPALASTVKVLTIFADAGQRTLSVTDAVAGADYSVCLGLIDGTRQCNFKSGKVKDDGSFSVEVPAGAGRAVANFSFDITVTNRDGSKSPENWRRIGNTNGQRKAVNSEVQKLNRLPDLQDPNRPQLAGSSSFPFIVPQDGLFNEFQLTSSDVSQAYQVVSARLYTGLDPVHFLPGAFDSPSAVASGVLALELVDLLIPQAGGDADPSVALTVGPLVPGHAASGYELLVATLRPILDFDADRFGDSFTYTIASDASSALPEPGVLLLLGTACGLAAAGGHRRATGRRRFAATVGRQAGRPGVDVSA